MRARTRHLAKRRFLVATKRLKYYVRRYRHRSNPARRPGAGSRSLIGLPVSVDVIHARSLLPPACETTATTTVVVKMKNEKPIGRTRRARNRARTTPKNLETRLRPVVCARDGTDRWRRTDETTPRRHCESERRRPVHTEFIAWGSARPCPIPVKRTRNSCNARVANELIC